MPHFYIEEPLETPVGMESAVGRLRQQPAATHLLNGHSSVYTGSLLIGAATNQAVAIIDGATRFNSYTLSRIAAALQRSPKALLRQTYVTRSFTAFQTEAAITTKLVHFLRIVPCRLVVILGLLHTYYDEQVTPHECGQSLRRIFHAFDTLTRNNTHVLVADVRVDTPPPGKETLFHLLHQAADIVAFLDQRGITIEQSPAQQGVNSYGTQQRHIHACHRQEQRDLAQVSPGVEKRRSGAV
jgi:hypothetical protein